MIIDKSTETFSGKLNSFIQEYDRFFEYLHYKTESTEKETLSMYNPSSGM